MILVLDYLSLEEIPSITDPLDIELVAFPPESDLMLMMEISSHDLLPSPTSKKDGVGPGTEKSLRAWTWEYG